jgi:ABC-2 type transport system ATP-binding protein
LRVPRGSAFGYLGPNGAGKTTLIRTLLGLTAASAGTMRLLGLPIPERRAEALSRVGAIVEEPRFHAHLSGRENLQIVAAARGPEAAARIDAALDQVGLAQRGRDRIKTYSLGMRRTAAGCSSSVRSSRSASRSRLPSASPPSSS